MPLRFGDMGMFINDFKPNFRSDLPHGLINSNLQRKHDAKQNELAVEANRSAATAKAGSEMQIKQMGIDADKAKVADENRKKFMERLTNAARSGDDGQLAAVANEAKQYGLELKHEKRGATTTPDILGGGEIQLPAKNVFRVRDIQTGDEQIFDMDKQRDINRERTTATYGAAGRNARKEDANAHRQAFEAIRASGMPLDAAMKLSPLDSPTHILDRQSREKGQQASLGEARMHHADSLAQRAAEHADRIGLQRDVLDTRKSQIKEQNQARDANEAKNWSQDAFRMATNFRVKEKREVSESAANVLRLLDPATINSDATAGKAQVIAIGELAKMAQGGDPRLSDTDRRTMAESWSIINRVGGVLSRGATGELSDQDVLDFKEAISRVIINNDAQNKKAFEAMVRSRPVGFPEGVDQYDRHINANFGSEPWFDDAATEAGVRIYGKENTPAPSSPTSSAPPPSDEEAMNILNEVQ